MTGRLSLRTRILLMMLACWLVPIAVLGAYMGSVFFDSLRNSTQAFLSARAQLAHERTREEVERMIRASKDVTYDGVLEHAAAEYRRGTLKYQSFYRTSRAYLNQRFSRERGIKVAVFFLFSEPERLMYTQGGEEGAERYAQGLHGHVLGLSSDLDTATRFLAHEGELYLARNLYDRRLEPFGMLVFCLNQDVFFSPVLAAAPELGKAEVGLDGYHSPGFSAQGQTLGFSDSQELLLYTQADSQRDYSLITRFSMEKSVAFAQIDAYKRLMVTLLLGMLPIGVLIFLFANRRITRPLRKLAEASRRIEQGEWGLQLPMKGPDEIGQAGRAFTAMSLRLEELIDNSYRKEILLRDARIAALQNRVNPHFLNNALELINWQARMDGNAQIGAMIDALSTLLNASLDRGGGHLRVLGDELEAARAYFYFLSLRYGDGLKTHISANEALFGFELPGMIIQTLLENALEHGIAPAGGGEIRLEVSQPENRLDIMVKNTGRRMTSTDKARVAELLDLAGPGLANHLGLRSIAERLQLHYRGRAALSLGLGPDGGTVALISIPLTEKMDETGKNLQEST
ncbi:MAG: histidine kinase [Eubacteriales bacterium]|nr:histidine kinase [Eubacteriales bacterium]